MICERVQAELSRAMDEGHVLSPDVARHRSVCAECAEFEELTNEFSRRYRGQVRAGIERLRGRTPVTHRFPRKGLSWSAPLAAALLIVCLGAPGEEAPVLARINPVATSAPIPRIWPVDEDLSFLSVRDLLPVRLEDEFLPPQSFVEVALPKDLRF
jgi:hypothetical protein